MERSGENRPRNVKETFPPSDPETASSPFGGKALPSPVDGRATPSSLSRGLRAARQNLVPGLFLQALALLLVFLYYGVPAARFLFEDLARLKAGYGFAYSFFATAIFGGLIPFLYMRALGLAPWSHLLFFVLFWGVKGMEVDALYRLQDFLFASWPRSLAIPVKVIIDQFVYNPLWAAPTALLAFAWKDRGFRLRAVRDLGIAGFLRRELPPALLSTWGVWVPTVAAVYSLPLLLQVPLFNLVLCFWVLLFTALTRPAASER